MKTMNLALKLDYDVRFYVENGILVLIIEIEVAKQLLKSMEEAVLKEEDVDETDQNS